eukprot:TRINITY_DN4222_c0_g1_i1.p1 TRINITY_DN4222_c0_g1~~TRINITY_DN4222_c0_g1_i1.p1  ORF type:complete len:240 (+),score=39.65 TRINITY_DN4222_c0_g1_i1:223-942(+)
MMMVPDWWWRGWGGPHRVYKHLQNHACKVKVRLADADEGAEIPVLPDTTVEVQADGDAGVVCLVQGDGKAGGLWDEAMADPLRTTDRILQISCEERAVVSVLVPAEVSGEQPVGFKGVLLPPSKSSTSLRIPVWPYRDARLKRPGECWWEAARMRAVLRGTLAPESPLSALRARCYMLEMIAAYLAAVRTSEGEPVEVRAQLVENPGRIATALVPSHAREVQIDSVYNSGAEDVVLTWR